MAYIPHSMFTDIWKRGSKLETLYSQAICAPTSISQCDISEIRHHDDPKPIMKNFGYVCILDQNVKNIFSHFIYTKYTTSYC